MAKMNNHKSHVGANLCVRPNGVSKKSPLGGFRGLLPLLLFFSLFGCKEEGRIDHIDDSAPAPAQVRVTEIINTPGGAMLRYVLPNDKNLLYVKAEYEIQSGVIRETIASYFTDTLFLDGFGNTNTHDVRVYSIGKNEKRSEPVIVQVNPLTPPVLMATKQLKETFGGVAVDFENPGKANLALVLLADTAKNGYLSELQTFYSSALKGRFSVRGLDSIPSDYAVYLCDRWKNLSDTIYSTLTPLYEMLIPKNTWREYPLPGDVVVLNNNSAPSLWDEDYENWNYLHSDLVPLPARVQWDMGVTVKLSRLKLWPRALDLDRWGRGHPKVFEIYGSNAPNPNGDLDESWIPLGRFECVKPSGPGPIVTQEDREFANAGIDFDFEVSDFAPDPYVSVRYIRLVIRSTFNNTAMSYIVITELSLWGSIVK